MSSAASASRARSSTPKAKSGTAKTGRSSTSSSRRELRPSVTKPVVLSRCVQCGSTRILRGPQVVTLKNGAIRTVEAETCLRCGEIYFDLAAMEILAAARAGRRRVRAAT